MTFYIISFAVLFCAELSGNFHGLATVKGNRQMAALCGAISSALWCVKIWVVCSQPLTIITAFIGAYFGAICAWKINENHYTNG
jgi:hypothetical protein